MDNIESKLGDLFGIKEMSEAQKADFVERVGNIVMESAILRLLSTLDEKQVEELETKLVEDVEAEELFAHLLKNYPEFETIIAEEMAAFQNEAEQIMG